MSPSVVTTVVECGHELDRIKLVRSPPARTCEVLKIDAVREHARSPGGIVEVEIQEFGPDDQ
jgi:hypothetical protein